MESEHYIEDISPFVEVETREKGQVRRRIYHGYFQAAGGILYIGAALLAFGLAQGLVLGRGWWIRIWAAASDSDASSSPRIAYMLGDFPSRSGEGSGLSILPRTIASGAKKHVNMRRFKHENPKRY